MILKILLVILLLLPSTACAYDWCADANNIGCWLLEVDESPQTDSSVNSNTLTVTNATYQTATPPDTYSTGYYNFDGTGDYLRKTGASSDFEMSAGSSVFTFVWWVNPDNFTGDSFDNNVMAHQDDTSADGWGFSYGNTDDVILYTVGANTGNIDTSMVAGTWYHLAILYDQANDTVDIWVAGTRIYNNTSYTNTSEITSGDARLTFGDSDTLGLNEMDGQLDELAFFSDVLDSTDINDILDNGLLQAAAITRRIFGIY